MHAFIRCFNGAKIGTPLVTRRRDGMAAEKAREFFANTGEAVAALELRAASEHETLNTNVGAVIPANALSRVGCRRWYELARSLRAALAKSGTGQAST